MRRAIILFVFLLSCTIARTQNIYEITVGSIRFHSDAPQELIRASSDKLRGIIDIQKNTFAFKIGIGSFLGFNSPLQQEHFNENYMETDFFPEATFSGKIIEDINLTINGEYTVRAKGKLKIHGIEQERIIKAMITNRNGKITIQSDFIVSLFDHNIKIPRVVNSKLAPDINVSVNATLSKRH